MTDEFKCTCDPIPAGGVAKCPVLNVMMLARRQPDCVKRQQAKASPSPKNCNGCGPPSIVQQALTASQALFRFIGDGCKTTEPHELAIRQEACEACPLNSNDRCNGCGCVLSLKQQARLEHCPAYRWQPAVHEPRDLSNCTRHLIMHLWPTAAHDAWKQNLQRVAESWDLFNGRRVISVMTPGTEQKVVKGKLRKSSGIPLVPAADVQAYAATLGMAGVEWLTSPNQSKLGEVVSFKRLLGTLPKDDQNSVTFYCHSKGAKPEHAGNPRVAAWRETMYRVCLDWPTVQHALERCEMAGAFRRFGGEGFPTWHYSGTFFWFHNQSIFGRTWNQIQQVYYGVERWPGQVVPVEQSACLFGDGVQGESTISPYLPEAWSQQLNRQMQTWETARANRT